MTSTSEHIDGLEEVKDPEISTTTALVEASAKNGGVNLVERNPAPGGFPLVDPDRVGKKTQFDLVELASQIQTADKFTRAVAGSKLSVIADQVRFLQEQARQVLEEAELSKRLHHIACNFKKLPGTVYYVYKKKDSGQEYLSMISPEEWGPDKCPEFLAAYKLEHDMSWTPLKEAARRSDEEALIDKILGNRTPLQLTFN